MPDRESVASEGEDASPTDPHGYARAFVRLGSVILALLGIVLVSLGTRQR